MESTPAIASSAPRRSSRLWLGLVAILALGLLLYPILKPQKPDPKTLPDLPVTAYQWANSVVLSQPPSHAFTQQLMDDQVERALSRLEWGSPELILWTQNHLPLSDPRLVRRLLNKLEEMAKGSPLATRNFVQCLGIVGAEECVAPLLRLAKQDPDYVQTAAIQSLAHCPWSEEVEDVLADLSTHVNPLVRDAAKRAVLQRDDFWDEETILGFLMLNENEEVNLLLDEVGNQGLTFAVDAVRRHLNSQSVRTRQIAIRSLIRLDDLEGIPALESEANSETTTRIVEALTIYRDTELLPRPEIVRQLSSHPDGGVRFSLAQAMRPHPDASASDRESYLTVLRILADDPAENIRLMAIQQLFGWGQTELLKPYRDALSTAHGESLKESVRFLCERLQDPRAATLIRERIQGPVDPTDHANLLFGLRFVSGIEDVDHYVQLMLNAGTSEDRRGGTQTYLSEHAGLYLQSVGGDAVPALVAAFPRAENTRSKMLFLDSIRGVAEGQSELLEPFLRELILSPKNSTAIRLAAVDTIPFLRDSTIGPRIRELVSHVESAALGKRLLQVFLCYY